MNIIFKMNRLCNKGVKFPDTYQVKVLLSAK